GRRRLPADWPRSGQAFAGGAAVKASRTAQLPPFYTQGIGSLPRPQVARDALARRHEMGPERSRLLLDDLVRFAIRLQEQAGLDVVSDGEWRPTQYIREFLGRVGGLGPCRRHSHRGEPKTPEGAVRRMTAAEPVFAEDARFLVANTDRVTKFALPSPFLIAVRYWHEDYSREAYPTLEHFLEHLAEVLAREARALAEAGADSGPLAGPALTYCGDRELMAGA